jgi:hypothetical protein
MKWVIALYYAYTRITNPLGRELDKTVTVNTIFFGAET